jgi:hypothetical protein
MFRTIETTHDLWTKWTIELNNNFFVQNLKNTYEVVWRSTQIERVFFSRRKIIINEIRTRHVADINLIVVVKKLKLVRKKNKLSLHELWKMLNANKKKIDWMKFHVRFQDYLMTLIHFIIYNFTTIWSVCSISYEVKWYFLAFMTCLISSFSRLFILNTA